jgi:nucleolar protein 56
MYLYSNILGTFVFSQNFQVREKILFKKEELLKINTQMQNGEVLDSEKVFLEKFKAIKNLRKEPDEKELEKVFTALDEYKQQLYENNLYLTKIQIRESITPDLLIIQASCSIDEMAKSINLLVKRLREWYSYELPEAENIFEDNYKFAEVVSEKTRKELEHELKINVSMGMQLETKDAHAIKELALAIVALAKEKEKMEKYLEILMRKNCPNITEVAGFAIGAKLLSIAGSLRNIVLMPSSTIQLLGAEKALFRHMVNKNAKPPKYGILFQHQLIQKIDKVNRGKVARMLADKILLAAKLDYFKGTFLGDKIKKELESKFNLSY